MFEKSLTDLIRGIRANKKNEQKYIQACLQEIRNEVKSNDIDIKGVAVAKLTYLQMLGYDMSWASFHIVEVMSSPKILHKRTGYLAAAQSFQQDTDVLMLTTNLIKKDLASASALEIGIAVNGLSHIVTPDLSRDLCQDLVSMLNHSRPYIRKKVVLVLYKVFLKFPEALRLSFPRLKDKLDDPDASVVSATVSVVCELARKNPRNYLSLAPHLFRLLTTSSNNWMLIKIIKMFASLTPLEPRLVKKLLPPLTSLIQSTRAMSVLYECIHTVITGGFLEAAGDSSHALAATCVSRLRSFLEDPDQNLKYVGLLAMSRFLTTHPKLIAENKDIVLECIDDEDFSIRLRALDLVVGMANKKSLVDIVKRLFAHLVPPDESGISLHEASAVLDAVYRTDIINRIIYICSQNQYKNITNFEWYISILVGLAHVSGVSVGKVLTNQLMDVTVRVKSVRPFAVKQMFRLLSDKQFLQTAKKRDSNIEVMSAAAWICGEYCSLLDNIPATLECLLTPHVVDMPTDVQAVYVHNIMKIYSFWVNELVDDWNVELQQEFLKVTEVMQSKITMFTRSTDLEVKERGYNAKAIFDLVVSAIWQEQSHAHAPTLLHGLSTLFSIHELNPVAPKAQKKVPIPEGLDLDQWINEPLPDLVADSESDNASMDTLRFDTENKNIPKKKKKSARRSTRSDDDEDAEKRRAARIEAKRNDPYYIVSEKSGRTKHDRLLDIEDDIETIPVVELSLDDFDDGKKKKSKKGKKKHLRLPSPPPPVIVPEEMPDDAVESASDGEAGGNTKGSGAQLYNNKGQGRKDIFADDDTGLNTVDLSTPLGAEEKLPQMKTYSSPEEARQQAEAQAREERKVRRLAAKATTVIEPSAKYSQVVEDDSKKKKKKKTKTKETKETKPKSKPKSKRVKQSEEVPEENGHSMEVPDLPVEALMKDTTIQNKPISILDHDTIGVDAVVLLTDEEDEGLHLISTCLTITNKSTEAVFSNLRITPIASFDFRFLDQKRLTDVASFSDALQLEPNQSIDVVGYFAVLGDVRRGLCLRCDLQYDIQDSSVLNQHNLEVPVRPSVFIEAPQHPMDPAHFAALLAEHGNEFDYRDTATLQLPVADGTAMDQALITALGTITEKSHLQVVEVVPGAASLYAKSAQGAQVAGLLKYDLSTAEQDKVVTISIDLKCTDDGFLEAFVEEVASIQL